MQTFKKMKKIFTIILALISFEVLSQNVVKSYYDPYTKNHIHEEYQTNSYGNTNGYYKRYFESGGIKEKGNYVNGKANGTWYFYHEGSNETHCNGELLRTVSYSNGQKHGESKWWTCQTINGKKVIKYHYKYDKDQETYYSSYYENGNKKIEIDSTGYKAFYKTGKLAYIVPFANGKRNGKQVFYYENGKIASEEEYMNNSLTGTINRYTEQGVLEYSATVFLDNNKYQSVVSGGQYLFYAKVKRFYPGTSQLFEEYSALISNSNLPDSDQTPSRPIFDSNKDIVLEYYKNFHDNGVIKNDAIFEIIKGKPVLKAQTNFNEQNKQTESFIFQNGELISAEVLDKENSLKQMSIVKDGLIYRFSTSSDTIVTAPFYGLKGDKFIGNFIKDSGIYKTIFKWGYTHNKYPTTFDMYFNELTSSYSEITTDYDGYCTINFSKNDVTFFSFDKKQIGYTKFDKELNFVGFGEFDLHEGKKEIEFIHDGPNVFVKVYTLSEYQNLLAQQKRDQEEFERKQKEKEELKQKKLRDAECERKLNEVYFSLAEIKQLYIDNSTSYSLVKKKYIYNPFIELYESTQKEFNLNGCSELTASNINTLLIISKKMKVMFNGETKSLKKGLKGKSTNEQIELIKNW